MSIKESIKKIPTWLKSIIIIDILFVIWPFLPFDDYATVFHYHLTIIKLIFATIVAFIIGILVAKWGIKKTIIIFMIIIISIPGLMYVEYYIYDFTKFMKCYDTDNGFHCERPTSFGESKCERNDGLWICEHNSWYWCSYSNSLAGKLCDDVEYDCFYPYSDNGKKCTDSSQCQGACRVDFEIVTSSCKTKLEGKNKFSSGGIEYTCTNNIIGNCEKYPQVYSCNPKPCEMENGRFYCDGLGCTE
ncbi:hypothetical protein KKA15_01885 [Patescibacteria group bacterium]|nr:hypothetical protein [Patescibacteria group bacterium]